MIDLLLDPDTAPFRIANLRFDTPGEKVNLLSEVTLIRLASLIDELAALVARGGIRGVVLTSGKQGIFVAGADVKEFVPVARAGDAAAASAKARAGQAIFTRIERLGVPTVAAIDGACLGGGLELALACSARIAGDREEVALGLPEVRLGLVPGWGGTQRLPRLVGVTRGLDMILTGRSLTGSQAARIGLVDAAVASENVETAARAEAERLGSGGAPKRPKRPLLESVPLGRALIFWQARRRVLEQTRGHYPAPLAAIETVRYGIGRTLDEGLSHEADVVGRLIVGEVSRNLVGIFLASRAATATGRSAATISRIGVLGAGTMGGGIAAVAALSGVPVRLRDVSADALARGMAQVHKLAAERSRKGRLPRHEAIRRRNLVAPTVDSTGFSRCDLVIEAVVEDLEVKRQVLREVESLVAPSAIFATNTSSLSVTAIAQGAGRPGRVVGLHFFNPVDRMPLVEVVRGAATDEAAVDACISLARKMGKTPVVVNDTPGFIVNRILAPYLAEAMAILSAAGSPDRIVAVDRAMVDFGMPMGPFALLDQIGLDVAAKVADVMKAAFPDRPGDSRLLHGMMQAGLLGVKSGKGFYFYPRHASGGRPKAPRRPSPELSPLLANLPRSPADRQTAHSGPEIAQRLTDAMINEAAYLLVEKAVDRPEVIDLAMVFGTGFPPFRGGLLRYADAAGGQAVAERVASFGRTPAPNLVSGDRFYP